ACRRFASWPHLRVITRPFSPKLVVEPCPQEISRLCLHTLEPKRADCLIVHRPAGDLCVLSALPLCILVIDDLICTLALIASIRSCCLHPLAPQNSNLAVVCRLHPTGPQGKRAVVARDRILILAQHDQGVALVIGAYCR